jgi:selenium metabolism protein YedF
MKEIDARGLACPAPVLQTKAVIDKKNVSALIVIVDNEAAKQNVCRFLESNHYQTAIKRNDDNFIITGTLTKSSLPPDEKALPKKSDEKKIMVMCTTDRMGFGDDELGLKLMVSFIKTLKEMGPDLWRLVFLNNGVRLAIEGSEVLPLLQEYASDGLYIMVCGTCLTHFDLLAKKRVGETTNMLDIVTAMHLADKVINI